MPQGGCALVAGQPAVNKADDDWGTDESGGSSASVVGDSATVTAAGCLVTVVLAGWAREELCGSN